jgi:DNA-binding transcriptional regulator GbsR (MarR family)
MSWRGVLERGDEPVGGDRDDKGVGPGADPGAVSGVSSASDASDASAGPPGQAVREFIEDFASTLVAAGVPRMPARVFSCLLVSESGRLTSAELSAQLHVSPAAVSGAIQYLDTVHLVRRTRERGSRRDQYVVEHDVWYQATVSQDQLLDRWIGQLRKGLELVGPDTAAGDRLAETMEFFAFLKEEMVLLRQRWTERKRLRSTAS